MNNSQFNKNFLVTVIAVILIALTFAFPFMFSSSVNTGAEGNSEKISSLSELREQLLEVSDPVSAVKGRSATIKTSNFLSTGTADSTLYIRAENCYRYSANGNAYITEDITVNEKTGKEKGNRISECSLEYYLTGSNLYIRLNSVRCSKDGEAVTNLCKVTGRWFKPGLYFTQIISVLSEILPYDGGFHDISILGLLTVGNGLDESSYKHEDGVYTMRGGGEKDPASPLSVFVAKIMGLSGVSSIFNSEFDGKFEINLSNPYTPQILYEAAMAERDHPVNEYSETLFAEFSAIGSTVIENREFDAISGKEFLEKLGEYASDEGENDL